MRLRGLEERRAARTVDWGGRTRERHGRRMGERQSAAETVGSRLLKELRSMERCAPADATVGARCTDVCDSSTAHATAGTRDRIAISRSAAELVPPRSPRCARIGSVLSSAQGCSWVAAGLGGNRPDAGRKSQCAAPFQPSRERSAERAQSSAVQQSASCRSAAAAPVRALRECSRAAVQSVRAAVRRGAEHSLAVIACRHPTA